MKKTKKAVQRITVRSIMTTFMVAGLMFLIVDDPRPYALGFMIGALVSVLNFRLLSFSIAQAMKLSAKIATPAVSLGYFLRFTIYALILVLSVNNDSINFLTLVAGLLVVKFVVILSVGFQRFNI